MIISIASGKGGTGKTTVATNLALSIGSNVQLLDCDVEQPNAHLFIHPAFDRTETVTTPVPEIDEDAITEKGRELGVIQKGHHNGIEFIHGKLRVGEAMSPPLIKEVLSYRDPAKLTIVDAPPGTSCPVIETMKPADFVLLVTEPTPFGLNDLKLAVGATKILDIPCGLVINRSDMGDEKVKAYAADENLPILMEIPFDRRIAEVYSRGDMIVDVMPEWKAKFLELYEKIKAQLN